MDRRYIEGTWEQGRAFSPAVIVKGGTTVFVAGHGAFVDEQGKSLAGDFEAQTRQSFRNIEATLKRAGASLKDLATTAGIPYETVSAAVFATVKAVVERGALQGGRKMTGSNPGG